MGALPVHVTSIAEAAAGTTRRTELTRANRTKQAGRRSRTSAVCRKLASAFRRVPQDPKIVPSNPVEGGSSNEEGQPRLAHLPADETDADAEPKPRVTLRARSDAAAKRLSVAGTVHVVKPVAAPATPGGRKQPTAAGGG
jgi:hypothetical protein